MNKYNKTFNMIERILFGFLGIPVVSVFICVPILFCIENPMGIILGLITIPLGGVLMLHTINYAILNQPYKYTDLVARGRSKMKAVKTLKYTKLSMWFCFFGSIIHLGISIFSVIYAFELDHTSKIIMIVNGVISLILSIIFFLMAGKRKVDIKHHINIEE